MRTGLNLQLGQGQSSGGLKFGASQQSGVSNPFANAGKVSGGDQLDTFKAQFSGGVDLNRPAPPTSLGIGNRLALNA